MLSPFPTLALYIHIPWCGRKCPYCDFNSHTSHDTIPEQRYVDALLRDFDRNQPLIKDRSISSIFFGGGTPSLFSASAIDAIMAHVTHRAPTSKQLEVTLEANPNSAEADKFEAFRSAGINRLSIGIQSFNDQLLQRLGRIHSGKEAQDAVTAAITAGFDNFNLDLMFALPGQSTQMAVKDIQTAINLQPTHISHYQLTIEPNTLFYSRPPSLPEHDNSWEIQTACQSLLNSHNYAQYEISAYAKPEHTCRHNINYWQFGDYLGIGAGAHSKITDLRNHTIRRLQNIKHPQHYMEAKNPSVNPGAHHKIMDTELPLEFLMNTLRLRNGFELCLFPQMTNLPLSTLEPTLSELIAEGLLIKNNTRIHCTDSGWRFLDTILERFTHLTGT